MPGVLVAVGGRLRAECSTRVRDALQMPGAAGPGMMESSARPAVDVAIGLRRSAQGRGCATERRDHEQGKEDESMSTHEAKNGTGRAPSDPDRREFGRMALTGTWGAAALLGSG